MTSYLMAIIMFTISVTICKIFIVKVFIALTFSFTIDQG